MNSFPPITTIAICSKQVVLNNREGRRFESIYILQEKPKYTTYASFKNAYGHRSRVCYKVSPGPSIPSTRPPPTAIQYFVSEA